MSNNPDSNQITDLFTQITEDPSENSSIAQVERDDSSRVSQSGSSPVMRLESIEITNLWSYDYTHLDFDEGITVIAGMNGSGKSSLLESIFFALYGSKAGPAMDRALVDVLRIGSDLGAVSLKFKYGPHQYTAQMGLRRRGDNVISEKEACRLTRDDNAEWVGVEVVTSAIEELFGMNRDDFTNCVYVRQGEIDRLIRAGGKERSDMIDRLLRLEKLDRYARRSEDGARRAVNRYYDGLKQRSLDLEREIKRIEQEQAEKQLGKLENDIKTKRAEIEDFQVKLKKAEALKHDTEQDLKKLEEMSKEVKSLEESIKKKEVQLQEREKESRKIAETLESHKTEYGKHEEALGSALEQLNIPTQSVLDGLSHVQSWEELETLAHLLHETRENQEKTREQAENIQRETNLAVEKLSKRREDLITSTATCEAQLENLSQELDKTCKLVDEGKCPECGQPIESGDYSEQIKEQQAKIVAVELQLKEHKANEKKLRSDQEALKDQNDEKIAKLREEYRKLEQRKTQLESVKANTERLIQLRQQAEMRRESRKSLADITEALRDDIAQLKQKLSEQSQKIHSTNELESKLKQIEPVVKELHKKLAHEQREHEELINKRGGLQGKIDQLAHLKSQRELTSRELEGAERVHAELQKLTQFYGDLKTELRKENIKALEHYFNEFFRVMDSGASYSRVKIDSDYDILVELKDGGEIRPELLSGGERALINIALRSAIHQVLSHATSRMPLILDEPTIYLDRDRITRLQYLLEALGSRIGQVIVVSHEAGLVEGADHEYRTEKRADNTSHVYQIR